MTKSVGGSVECNRSHICYGIYITPKIIVVFHATLKNWQNSLNWFCVIVSPGKWTCRVVFYVPSVAQEINYFVTEIIFRQYYVCSIWLRQYIHLYYTLLWTNTTLMHCNEYYIFHNTCVSIIVEFKIDTMSSEKYVLSFITIKQYVYYNIIYFTGTKCYIT